MNKQAIERNQTSSRNLLLKKIAAASIVSLTLAAHLMAQQEISPDRFESTAQGIQRSAVPQKTRDSRAAAHKEANIKTAKVQNGRQAPGARSTR